MTVRVSRSTVRRAPCGGIPRFRPVMYIELDRREEAAALLVLDSADGFAAFRYNSGGWLMSLCIYGEVCAYLREPSAAAVLYDKVSPYADHITCAGQFSIGSTQRYVGLLAKTLGHTSQAAEDLAPAYAARTRLDLADTLIARKHPGDLEKARALSREALDTARRLGCTLIERRAEHSSRHPPDA